MADSSSSPSMHPYNHNFTDEDLNDILGASLMEDPSHSGENSNENPGSSGAADHACRTKVDDDDDDLDGISSDAKTQARTERKRSREKQRRSDVNRQFADLSQLLRRIESEEEGRTSLPLSSAGPTNRVDLIARTINIMERTHELSKKRKTEIAGLQKQLEDSQKMAEDTAARLKEATLYQHPGQQKQVMMMVPMMVNPDSMAGGQPGATAASYPHAMMPQMMAHPYMMPQMPAPTAGHHMMMPQMMYMPQAPPPPVVAPQAPPPPQQQVQQQAQQQQAPLQQTQQQTDGQPKTGQQQNVSGGNLAHCA